MKKSGLADSPFFRPAPLSAPPPVAETSPAPSIPEAEQSLPASTITQPHNRADAQPHEHTTTQIHKGTDTQLNERTDAQPHERTTTQPARPKNRESYDVYVDQAQTIEELRLKWSKERRKYITKGQVMRELLDEILPTKR